MTYVNLTGKYIGECLTGFGINWPITIINSGNSDVFYTFDIENDSNQLFSLSQSSLSINNGKSATIDIFYKPQEIASATDNTCDFLIYSESIEDGTPDPSGIITVEITGSRIINNTAGYVRNLVALKNYDRINWINYDFIWSPPTGTGNLKNYFFTGYQLDISKNNIFTNIVFSTGFNIAENTDKNPRFGKYYGYNADEKIIKNISNKDFTSIDLEQDYYARLYTYSVGNSGINIYASGINTLNDQLSNEVINGFSGAAATRPNLRFYKKMLDVIVTQGNYVDYNIYQKILDTNGGSSDLSFYSGINIYLSAGSTFSSSSENSYAFDFKNGIFQNFTGNSTDGTNINIYIPERISIAGNHGKGGDLSNPLAYIFYKNNSTASVDLKPIFDASSYSSNNGMSDSKNGGNALNLNNKIQIKNESLIKTDINYNLFIQNSSVIAAGGGGNKAGVAIVGGMNNYIGTGSDNIDRSVVFPVRGSNNYQNTYFSIRAAQRTTLQDVIKLYSPNPQYGEDAIDNIIIYKISDNTFIANSNIKVYNSSLSTEDDIKTLPALSTRFIKINNNSPSSCGYLVNKYSNSNLKVNFYNDAVVSDYIFRCNNSDLSNTSPQWIGKNSQSTTVVTLTGDATHVADFEGLGYEAISIPNTKYLQGSFSSSVNCTNFDLFIVGCFKGSSYNEQIFKMLNWYSSSSSNNVSSKNVLLRPFLNTAYKAFSKEDNVFSFFFSLLYNNVISNNDKTTFFQATNDPSLISSFSQISKQLNGTGNYYPFILNIHRSNNLYAIFINGQRYCIYGLPEKSKYINDLINTTLKLTNDSANITNYFFDIIFYNRSLFDNERAQMYNSLNKQYIKLFAGETGSSLLVDSQIRLPNIFNLAGKINTQT